LSRWESVQAACSSQEGIITCVVNNRYDHLVRNITLRLPFPGYWYTQTGELLKENAEIYTLDSLASTESLTLLITQEPLFQVTITKPEKGIYIANIKVLPFFFPAVFGRIDVEATVRIMNETGIDQVEFYLDNELQVVDTMSPYSWRWSKRSFGFHRLHVVAYQNDVSVNDELMVLKIL
jgi:hypothetical protein